MLHYIFLLFCIISLNSNFIAFDSDKNNNSENLRKEKQADSSLKDQIDFDLQNPIDSDFYNLKNQSSKNKKILFALHIKKRTKQDLLQDNIVSFEDDESPQKSLQAKLKKKLQKLREKLQPRKHAIVVESIVLGTATSGAGAGITMTTVAGFGPGCGAAGTLAAATGTTVVTTTGGITIGGVLTGIGTFVGSFVTWPVVVTVAAGGLVIGAIADEAEKKNKLDQEEALKKREQEKIELEKQKEQDFIRIKEKWQKLQQEDSQATSLNSENLKESILQSAAYKSFFLSFNGDPDDDEDDDEPVLLILGPSIQTNRFVESNQHVQTGIKDGISIYVPVNQGSQVCIYVPAQNDNPPLIYVPAQHDNPPCIYVPTQEEAKNLILHCDPTIGIGGALIGGGAVSGGAIPIIVGGGLAVAWTIKEGIPLLKGIIDKIKQHREEKKVEEAVVEIMTIIMTKTRIRISILLIKMIKARINLVMEYMKKTLSIIQIQEMV